MKRSIQEVIYEANNADLKDTNTDCNSNESSGTLSDDNYTSYLSKLRDWLSTNHASVLAATIGSNDSKSAVMALINDYIASQPIGGNIDFNSLVNRLYSDLAEFAFLNKYLEDESVEEINCNAYDDVEVLYRHGFTKVEDKFNSPGHCADIVKKMMRIGGITLDEKVPLGDSFISKGVRVSAMIYPAVDEDVGAVFSIRRQKSQIFSKQELVQFDTCTDDEFEFLNICLRHGVSVGIAGATSSGKTSTITSLLDSIVEEKRIFIIEDTRETYLNKVTKDGQTLSRIVYTKTREDESGQRNITASNLLRASLRYHPDIIVPAEMRDEVAMVAIEAGRTGHTILAGLHANNAKEAYDRILTMCMMSGTRLSEELLMRLIISAFPIMVFMAQLPDKTRKILTIFEAEEFDPVSNKIKGNTIYEFDITGNVKDKKGNITKMIGSHLQKDKISNYLATKLIRGGCDREIVRKYANEEFFS